jgi:hypothetical protein
MLYSKTKEIKEPKEVGRMEMSCLFAHRNAANNVSRYATDEGFRNLFTEDADSLYLLSFLLTADHRKAEQCFVTGLDDCADGNAVFREWVHSWARRIIVRNAIRIMTPHLVPESPKPDTFHRASSGSLTIMPLEYSPFLNILALGNLERFVFVLSVLEKYPEQECASLLGMSQQAVRDTRARALLDISRQAVGDTRARAQHAADFERRRAAPAIDRSGEEVDGRRR